MLPPFDAVIVKSKGCFTVADAVCTLHTTCTYHTIGVLGCLLICLMIRSKTASDACLLSHMVLDWVLSSACCNDDVYSDVKQCYVWFLADVHVLMLQPFCKSLLSSAWQVLVCPVCLLSCCDFQAFQFQLAMTCFYTLPGRFKTV